MGCSASTQGGLYATPNDDDDTRWSPTNRSSGSSTSFDVMMEDYKETYYSSTRRSSSSGIKAKEGTSNSRHGSAKRRKSMGQPSSSCCHHEQHEPCCAHHTETANDSLPCAVTSLCQNKLTESPLRKPFPSSSTYAQNVASAHDVQNSMPQNLSSCTNYKGRLETPSSSYLQPRNNKQLNDSINSIIDTSLHDHSHTLPNNNINNYQRHHLILDQEEEDDEFPSTEETHIFSNRQWLVLPEQKYDMNTLHLPPPSSSISPCTTHEMYLGSMYWTAASPERGATTGRKKDTMKENGEGQVGVSLLSPSTGEEEDSAMEISNTPRSSKQYYTGFGIQDDDVEPPRDEATSVSSETTTADNNDDEFPQVEEGDEEEESFLMFSPKQSVDISRELLDYSHLEESYILEQKRSHQPPRRLFDEEEEEEDVVMCDEIGETSLLDLTGDDLLDESFEIASPSRLYHRPRCGLQNINEEQPSSCSQKKKKNGKSSKSQKFSSILCMGPTSSSQVDESIETSHDDNVDNDNVQQEVAVRVVTPPTCPSSPGVATFYGHWGSRRERHVSTLPSTTPGQPIRLRVTDKSSHLRGHNGIGQSMSSTSQTSPGDYYSYDPYFSSGKYTITLPNGKPYGNGLVIKMGLGQFMILQDARGVVLAVIKSRYTYTPSMVVYAPKPKFVNQVPSGHRLTRRVVGNANDDDGSDVNRKKKKSETTVVIVDGGDNESDDGEALYPWALISKSGRTMGDMCSVHLVNDNVNKDSSSASSLGGKRTKSTSSGIFNSEPSFCGRHEFDRELHTHTVVSRKVTPPATSPTTSSSSKYTSSSLKNKSKSASNSKRGNSKKNSKPTTTSLEEEGEEVPCCVIVRDSTNLDAVDITIAPGIDPLLMICYLASHSKMDVEPLLSGY